MVAEKPFNKEGIFENNDGSFFAEDKRAKKRLLKQLHTKGYKVRSRNEPEGGFTVTPIGHKKFKKSVRQAPVQRGSLSTRSPTKSEGGIFPSFDSGDDDQPSRRSTRPRSMVRPRAYRTHPRSYGYQGQRTHPVRTVRQLGVKGSRYIKRQHEEKLYKLQKDQDFKNNAKETDEKMKKERIASEQQAERDQREKAASEHEYQKKLRDQQKARDERIVQQNRDRVESNRKIRDEEIATRQKREREAAILKANRDRQEQIRRIREQSGHQERPFHQPQTVRTFSGSQSDQKVTPHYEPKPAEVQKAREDYVKG
jgi:hypothetical protein